MRASPFPGPPGVLWAARLSQIRWISRRRGWCVDHVVEEGHKLGAGVPGLAVPALRKRFAADPTAA